MRADEYRKQDAVGLARLVATGEVTAHELLDAAMTALETVNPRLNAVILDLELEARRAIDAGLPDGPLRGVPYLIKDIGAAMAGVPTSAGSALFKDAPAAADTPLVTALRRAGLVLFGKTNTPEFGMMPTTEPKAFGPTRNPWDLTRTAGGSSGGAAAAVAAGIAPAAHGSDGGGSIRIPAACCGLFGFKPSRGLVSPAPYGPGPGWFVCDHALTRSVRDSAALLDAIVGPTPGDLLWLPPPATPFAAEIGRDPGRLKIGFTAASLSFGDVDPDGAAAVHDAAKLCESLGHYVEEVRFEVDLLPSIQARHALAVANISYALAREGARRGRPVRRDEVEAMTWSVHEQSADTPLYALMDANRILNTLGYEAVAAQRGYDVLLTPTLGGPPARLGALNSDDARMDIYGVPQMDHPTPFLRSLYGFMPNTHVFNTTGQPAMSAPLTWNAEGLPIGVQFVAGLGADALLFRLASQLEAVRPWMDRVPIL